MSETLAVWTIESDHVRAVIQSQGAMLAPGWFKLGEREVQPFAIAPWSADSGPQYEALPKILQRLRGEWACVPYGIERAPGELPGDWEASDADPIEFAPEPHGRSSNAEWTLSHRTKDSIVLSLDYPDPHPVKRVERRITASSARPELELRLAIEARTSCAIPIGVHPTFRLPMAPHRARLEFGTGTLAWTSPVPLEADIACFRSDVRKTSLDRIPLTDGTTDITRLPLSYSAEEIVLTTGHSGRATLTNLDERYTVTLAWDPGIFPACQLWLSNWGRHAYPWNNRFLALGIEPIRAAFDLGTRASRNRSNPLWKAGIPCTMELSPASPFETAYRIGVMAVDEALEDSVE